MDRSMTHNILSKKDESIIELPSNGGKVSKKDRYSWATPGNRGSFRMISKRDINIDGRYQREQVSENKVRKIAREWDWKLFGCASVVQRSDGTYWAFDTGHRVRASFYRSDIDKLPCMVFSVENVAEEAKAFVGTNVMHTNVTAYQKYKSSLCAKEPTAEFTKSIMDKRGYEAGMAESGKYIVRAIGTLLGLVEKDRDLAEAVFDTLALIAIDGEQIPNQLLRGLFSLANRLRPEIDVLSGVWFKKIKTMGIAGLMSYVRAAKFNNNDKGGEATEARGIMNALNKGLRTNNIKWE